MGVAVLLFGLLVGFFHFTGSPPADAVPAETLSAEPAQPASYKQASNSQQKPSAAHRGITNEVRASTPYTVLASARSPQERAQAMANMIAARPSSAARIVTIALAQGYDSFTLGDVATLAATATKAAPDSAPAIAAAVARAFSSQSDPALAAAIATIISLVPERAHDIGLVVGAVIGDDTVALGMIAQTVAIAVGEETFSSLSDGSGVAVAKLMRQSSRFGVNVPFDVPDYAAQLAPSASVVAESGVSPARANGGL